MKLKEGVSTWLWESFERAYLQARGNVTRYKLRALLQFLQFKINEFQLPITDAIVNESIGCGCNCLQLSGVVYGYAGAAVIWVVFLSLRTQ